MYKGKDMMGKSFGSLLVTGEAPTHPINGRRWEVRCSCGKEFITLGSSLRAGKCSSCPSCAHKTHGLSKSPSYHSWRAMVERCLSKTAKDYPLYGGAGVTVYPPWLKFENFYKDMGDRPVGTSLDRFPNKFGPYEPGNCRWATPKEQALNTKSVRLYSFNGIIDSLRGWSIRVGISEHCMAKRIKKWPLNRALSQPRTESKVFSKLIE